VKINVTGSGPVSKSETINADTGSSQKKSESVTSIDSKETETGLEVSMEMEGATPDTLSVALTGRKLTVEHKKEEETRTAQDGGERVERTVEKRTKEVTLPCDVNPEKVDAVLKDGILRVNFEKRSAERVQVKVT